MTVVGAGNGGTLTVNTTATITAAGKTQPGAMTLNGTSTVITQADDWIVGGLVILGTTSQPFTLNGNVLHCLGGLTNTTATVTGTTKISLEGGTWTGAAGGSVANNIDIAGNVTLASTPRYTTGTLKYVSGVFNAAASTLTVVGSATLQLGASAHLFNLTFTVALTLTRAADLYVDGTTTYPNANITWAGAFNGIFNIIAGTTLTASRTHTFVAGQTETITQIGPTFCGTSAFHLKLVSSSPGTRFKMTLPGPAVIAPQNNGALIYTDATDVDSSAGYIVYAPGGVLSNTINWQTADSLSVFRRWPQGMIPIGGLRGQF